MTAKVDGVRWNITETNLSFPSSISYKRPKTLVVSATNYRDGEDAEFISILLSPHGGDTTYSIGAFNAARSGINILLGV
jgi:hypothetical protein